MTFVQDNESMSRKGVLRGLHYQKQYPQGKLVRVIEGEVFDVAVDLRKDSPTFGQWFGVVLSDENKKQFYISPGFAHGFLVLSDVARFCYKCTDFYHPGDEGGLAWNDPEIGIKWPKLVGSYSGNADSTGYQLADGTPLNLSDKDKKWQGLKDSFVSGEKTIRAGKLLNSARVSGLKMFLHFRNVHRPNAFVQQPPGSYMLILDKRKWGLLDLAFSSAWVVVERR